MNVYKGVCYDVIYVKGATADQRYIAKSCDGSYSAHGATEDEAKNHFMIKIDQIPVHREINNMPLSDTEVDYLVKYCTEPKIGIFMRRRLEKKHYFMQKDFPGLSHRAIINHCQVIEDTLNSQGNHFKLDYVELTINYNSVYAIYDLEYFNTSDKILSLKKILEDEFFS